MDDNIKAQYKKSTEIYLNNLNLVRSKKIDEFNFWEQNWLNLADHFYVIGTEDSTEKFIETEAKNQGLDRLITKVIIPSNTYYRDLICDNDEYKELKSWITSINSNQFRIAGCHLSHAKIAKDVLSKNFRKVLIFEDDCSFKVKYEVSTLQKIIDLINNLNQKIDFLNLGTTGTSGNDFENLKIIKKRSSLTHSYILSIECAEILSNSVDIDMPHPNTVGSNNSKNHEVNFRAGADDFFWGYVENCYIINPATTFQKNIGTNREILT